MQALVLSEHILKRINRLLFKFVWNGEDTYREEDLHSVTECVKCNIMTQNFDSQGLNMVDMKCMQDTFCTK